MSGHNHRTAELPRITDMGFVTQLFYRKPDFDRCQDLIQTGGYGPHSTWRLTHQRAWQVVVRENVAPQ